jgi:hypothetical protein
MLLVASAPLRSQNVTGTYFAEDGAIYYVQQSGNVVSWAGMGIFSELPAEQQLRRGLTYTNIFRGTYTNSNTITGDWVEVSRGTTLGSGSVTLLVNTTQTPSSFTKIGGSFRTSTWTPRPALDDTTDIFVVFDNIFKNDGGSLHDNLKPYRDGTVAYAHVTTDGMTTDQTVESEPPHVNYGPDFVPVIDKFHNFGLLDRSFDSFLAEHDARNQDGDFDFRLKISQSSLEPDFKLTGWGNLAPDIFENKFNDSAAHTTLGYTPDEAYLGAEGVMWGIGDVSHPTVTVPAWAQLFNSILVNGRPIDGVLRLQNPTPTCNFPQPCPFVVDGARFSDGIQLGQLKIVAGDYVRVTGTLVVDCGHGDFWNLFTITDPVNPCYDDAGNDDDSDVQNQELHPISSIDIIKSPFRPEDAGVSARQNLTGTWGGNEGSTYYLRQIGNTVWWLGMPRDRQPMQRGINANSVLYVQIDSLQLGKALRANPSLVDFNANCGPGTAIFGVLLGSNYPCWAFANVFKGIMTLQSDGTSLIQGDWIGVPQSSSPGNVGTTQSFTVDALRKTIQPVSTMDTIFPSALSKMYEPEDTVAPTSSLTFGTPHYTSATNQTFVSASTLLTVSASDFDSGPQNIWHREFLQGTVAPEYTPVAGSSASFTLVRPDGLYEVDSYATDNAGNDETAHTAFISLDTTAPLASITQPAATQYGHSDPLTLNYNVSDGLGSGVQSVTPTIDGLGAAQFGSNMLSGQTIYLYSLGLGTHAFSLATLDNVNNAAENSVTFTIAVTAQSLTADVNNLQSLGCIDDIGQALDAKIASAQSFIAKAQPQQAINILSALTNELEAQAGKHISTACKDPNGVSFNPVQLLLDDTQFLSASLASQI